jgi:hypothetical protein
MPIGCKNIASELVHQSVQQADAIHMLNTITSLHVYVLCLFYVQQKSIFIVSEYQFVKALAYSNEQAQLTS